MKTPKNYETTMGRSAQVRYARNTIAVAILIAAILYSVYGLAAIYLAALVAP